jgi:hypothetical protein
MRFACERMPHTGFVPHISCGAVTAHHQRTDHIVRGYIDAGSRAGGRPRLPELLIRIVCGAAASLTLASIALTDAYAQSVAPTPPRWKRTAEANGTLIYGAASQRLFSAAVGAAHSDSQYELSFNAMTAYGDSRDITTGSRQITVRNSRISTSYDLHPHDRLSPFAFGSAETNYQQRYRSRLSLGAGAKLIVWRPDSVVNGFVQDASMSLAVLAEATRAMPDASARVREAAGNHTRWSLRVRYRKRLNDTIRFSHVTLYQPTVDRLSSYTLESVTELAIPLGERLQFTVSHRERLDSEAVKRGAASIQDGQLLFGLRATF